MGTDLYGTARRLRELVEPISSGVYFAPEAQERYKALGLNYFEGYFCSRSACLGQLPWRAVTGIFAAFNPAVVEPAVTGGWAKTEPEPLLQARLDGARAQLERLLDSPKEDMLRAAEILLDISDDVDVAGRPLYAGLRSLSVPGEDDPAARPQDAPQLAHGVLGVRRVIEGLRRHDPVERGVREGQEVGGHDIGHPERVLHVEADAARPGWQQIHVGLRTAVDVQHEASRGHQRGQHSLEVLQEDPEQVVVPLASPGIAPVPDVRVPIGRRLVAAHREGARVDARGVLHGARL
jgi:hypothetical protein